MSAPPQNQRDPARLNPFAFPSDTSFRFIILIMTIVSTSIFIYSSIYRKIPVNIQASTVVSQHCNDVAIQAAHSVLSQNGIYDTIYAKEFLDCIAPFDRIEILWITLGLGLLFSSALAMYWSFPWWKIRRGKLIPLTASNAPAELLEALSSWCRQTDLVRFPLFLTSPYPSANPAEAFGRLGQYYLPLDLKLLMSYPQNQELVRAVVLHELGHIRNADIDKTYFTKAIGWAFGIVALLPWIVVQFLPPWDLSMALNAGWRILLLTILIYLARNAVLRARELYADVRASDWDGAAGSVKKSLTFLAPAKKGYLPAWSSTHPSPALRTEILDDTHALFRQGFGTAFAIGIVAGNITVHASFYLTQLHFELAGINIRPLVIGLLFAPLLIGTLGPGIWRTTFARQITARALPDILQVSIELTLGLLCGEMLAGLNYVGLGYFILYPVEQQWSFITFWTTVGWITIRSILLLVILFFLLYWIRAGASIWLKIAASSPSPQRAYRVALLLACYVLAVVLGQFAFIMDVVSQDMALPVSKISLILFNLATDPFLLIAFICLWLYPLAAWFWSKRTATVSTASWAFLKYPAVPSPAQQVVPLPAFTAPGLALAIGLAGGLVFCILLLLCTLLLQLPIEQDQSMLLAVFFQGGLAVIVAVKVRQFGGLHGLFAAFVGGCVMAGVVIGMSALAGTIPASIVWYIFLSIINQGALVTLPVGYASSELTGLISKALARQRKKLEHLL